MHSAAWGNSLWTQTLFRLIESALKWIDHSRARGIRANIIQIAAIIIGCTNRTWCGTDSCWYCTGRFGRQREWFRAERHIFNWSWRWQNTFCGPYDTGWIITSFTRADIIYTTMARLTCRLTFGSCIWRDSWDGQSTRWCFSNLSSDWRGEH